MPISIGRSDLSTGIVVFDSSAAGVLSPACGGGSDAIGWVEGADDEEGGVHRACGHRVRPIVHGHPVQLRPCDRLSEGRGVGSHDVPYQDGSDQEHACDGCAEK